VIAAPPFVVESVQTTLALPAPAVAVGVPGLLGTVDGVTGVDFVEGGLVPSPFVATTVKVYAVPFLSPVTVHERS